MTIVKSQIRRGQFSQLSDTILDVGELGLAKDQNRVFIGTDPIRSVSVNDTVTFSIAVGPSGNTQEINLESIIGTFKIYKVDATDEVTWLNEFPAPTVGTELLLSSYDYLLNDNVVSLATPSNGEILYLCLNQELTASTTGEEHSRILEFRETTPDPLVTLNQFDPPIVFDEDIKNAILIEYYIFNDSNTFTRNGQWKVSVNGPNYTMSDSYDQTGISDLVFELDNNEIKYSTSDTDQLHLSFKQTSFQKRSVS